jgi:hypothetical protein
MATDKGTSNNPATSPADNPTNGISTLFTIKAPSKPANAAAARKKAGAPTSNAPATTGNKRGAPSTTKGATPLMRSCWLDPTMERAPDCSMVGRRDSTVARSSPFFSSLERIPYSAVRPRRSSSRTRLTTSYWE